MWHKDTFGFLTGLPPSLWPVKIKAIAWWRLKCLDSIVRHKGNVANFWLLCSAASLRQLQLACVQSKVLIISQVGGTFSPATWSQFQRTWTIRNGTALIIISTQLPLLAIWHSGVVKSHPALQFWPWRGTECVIYSTRTGWNLRLCFKISLPIYQPRMRWKFFPFLLYYNFFCCIFFFIFSQLAVNSFYAARSFFSLFGGQMVTGFNGFGSGRRQRIAQF